MCGRDVSSMWLTKNGNGRSKIRSQLARLTYWWKNYNYGSIRCLMNSTYPWVRLHLFKEGFGRQMGRWRGLQCLNMGCSFVRLLYLCGWTALSVFNILSVILALWLTVVLEDKHVSYYDKDWRNRRDLPLSLERGTRWLSGQHRER